MRARLLLWLADTWWRMLRRPAPWTWRARQEAVRTAEGWLRAQHLRTSGQSPAPGPAADR